MADVGAATIPHGLLLTAFVEAVVKRENAALPDLRQRLIDGLGPAALADAAAIVASFSAVVKLADGAGIPLETAKESLTVDLRDALGIDEFRS